MNRRIELTLIGLLVMAVLAAGILIWGHQTGQFKIFGDAAVVDGTSPLPIGNPGALVNTKTITEDFLTTDQIDTGVTTAWVNPEAGSVTLPLGGTVEATVQSLSSITFTAETVRAQLVVDAFTPPTSTITYEISDNGQTWAVIEPDGDLEYQKPVGKWRWRATLRRGSASVNPELQQIKLRFDAVDQSVVD